MEWPDSKVMTAQSVSIEILSYRENVWQRQWELPPWGHPLAQGVFPLFYLVDGLLFPVGTAFTIGRGTTFVVSAAHNINEALRREQRLRYHLDRAQMSGNFTLREVGLSVLHQRPGEAGRLDLTIWPLEFVNGAPPTDIVFGFPQFQTEFPTLSSQLSFDLPQVGERVWSIGYTDMAPRTGIPMSAVLDGSFNWLRDYSHKFVVVEGTITHVFAQRFANGFVDGPCFTFDATIPHALSGGPIISAATSIVRGMNSAGADLYLNEPATIGSLLTPLLMSTLSFGAQLAPGVRINATSHLIQLIGQGFVRTDGSEERVGISQDAQTGQYVVHPRGETSQVIYDDFAGLQNGRRATSISHEGVYRFRRTSEDTSGGSATDGDS